MTTFEAMKKLRNYDELEGKYYAALARIDEYERERAEIREKAISAMYPQIVELLEELRGD